MTRGESAKAYFESGYNCAQAVALAFQDLTGVSEDALKGAAIAFGGGLGRMRQTCGAVSGACLCLGLIFPQKSKSEIYALVQELAARFKEENGSINCGELLSGAGVRADSSPQAEARTPAYYRKRPCGELVASAAEILEEIVREAS